MPRAATLASRPNGQDLNDLAAAHPAAAMLDLVHVTEVGAANAILAWPTKQIETRQCEVFGENLVYFFLGRPDYRRASWDQDTDDITAFPVAFVLDSQGLGEPKHIYPLDSGAASRGYFSTYGVSKYVRLEDLRIADVASALQHITRCFGSATRYVRGQLASTIEPDANSPNWIDTTFQKMARVSAQGANAPDNRASAVEFAYAQHIRLAQRLNLLVLPSVMQGEGYEAIRDAVKDLAPSGRPTRIEYYDWVPDRPPASNLDAIRGIVERYLIEKGQIEES